MLVEPEIEESYWRRPFRRSFARRNGHWRRIAGRHIGSGGVGAEVGLRVARLPDLNVADVALILGVVELPVVIGEVGLKRRLIIRSDQRAIVALQAVDDRRAAGGQLLRIFGVVAQRVAGRPQCCIAGAALDCAILVVPITQSNAPGRIAIIRWKADGVLVWYRNPDARRRRIVGDFALEAPNDRLFRVGKDRVVVVAFDPAPLGDVHVIGVIENDVRYRVIFRRAGNFDLEARVGAERSVKIDGHGPDRWTFGDCVVEPPRAQAQPPDATLWLRKAPSCGILAVEGRTLDVGGRAIVGYGRKPRSGPSGKTMVKYIEQGTGRVEAIYEPGVEVGDEELACGWVEHDVTESGAAIAGHRSKEGHIARLAIDFPYAAWTAALFQTELAGHPFRLRLTDLRTFQTSVAVGIGKHDLKAESRGRTKIDTWRLTCGTRNAVETDREHLAYVTRLDLEHRRSGKELPRGRSIGFKPNDFSRHAIEIDEGSVERISPLRLQLRRPGEAGHYRHTLIQNPGTLSVGGSRKTQRKQKRRSEC